MPIVILAVMRTAQGVALGGTWDGLSSLLAMNAPENQRGWYAMIPQLGAPVGLFVASALFVYLVTGLSEADFLEWGWRYPFFVAFAINVVALFARLRIVVTPEYAAQFESLELQPTPVRETLAAEGVNILIGAFIPLATFALFHMVTVFPLSWVYLTAGEEVPGFLGIEIGTALVGLAAIIASGVAGRPDRPAAAAHHLRGGDRGLRAGGAGAARRRADRRVRLHGGRLGAARPLLRPVLGRGRLALQPALPLHRLGADLGSSPGCSARASRRFVALFLAATFGLFSSGFYLLSGAVCTIVALLLSQRLDLRND